METEQQHPSVNPLQLVSFLLLEFSKLRRIEDVFERLGHASFSDISTKPDTVEQWEGLRLAENDKPHMLEFMASASAVAWGPRGRRKLRGGAAELSVSWICTGGNDD
jgi:hypothetical protein